MQRMMFCLQVKLLNELKYVLTFRSSSTNTDVKSNDGQ